MHLMEGEDPYADAAEDARHWQDIYARLIDFTQRHAALEASESDLDERLRRYDDRLKFWSERAWDLEHLVVDGEKRTVTTCSGTIALTRREFQILEILLENPGRSYSARRLLTDAWHDSALPEEAVRSYITRIRRKLDEVALGVIVTDPREGYRLVVNPPTVSSS